MAKVRLTPDAYTVGWVCVLECELNASRALLDAEHERLPRAENDDNVYLLGEISGHNVVIAFPAIYGVGAAARTATNIIRTFRNIRFGLMVGIGGGAPNPEFFKRPCEDIRLGDVVVSEPKGDQGGVVHYDMGQRTPDGKLHKRSHLNKPPTMLLTAMKLLRSDHRFGRGQMNRYITTVADISEAFHAYRHPGMSSDRLYRVDYDHHGPEGCMHCNTDMTEARLPRKSDPPVVHYGLIASGNAVIKDPRFRDELRKDWNVACFEMEAAGLMDNFPCLVIRGISDYSDSHKDDNWQPYAAVTAAAYAKDLLRVLLPEEVNAAKAVEMKEVFDVLSNIQAGVFELSSSLTTAKENELLSWLSSKDYGSEQTDNLSQRQEGTGTWLLERTDFQGWVSESNRTIYCRGMPGAGKTVMTAVVVDYLRSRYQDDRTVGIACIYCSTQNEPEQTRDCIFLSLLRQLIRQLSYTPKMVMNMYERHTRTGDRPSFREIVEALQDTITQFQRTFILVDALDELLTSETPPKQLVREIFAIQSVAGANVFATSRLVPEIEGEFKESIQIDIRAAGDDVIKFLHTHIAELPAFVSQTPGLEDEIETAIVDAIDGMFLLAKLHLTSLLDKISIREVKDTLERLPRGFDGYDRSYLEAMNNILGQRRGLRELALKAISWICCSRRLLLATELQHALAVKDKHTNFDALNIPDMGLVLSVCKGLVVVDAKRGTIRLVHYTTQQYFQRTWHEWFSDAHENIAEITVRYLTFEIFSDGPCPTGTEFKARVEQYALYDYAARNWGYHVRTALREETSLVLRLLNSGGCLASSAQAMFAERSQARSERSPRGMTGLHVAAFFGLEKTVRLLLHNLPFDTRDSSGRSPLLWASANGHAAVVEALLEHGADPDCADDEGQTALFLAAINGHSSIVDLLLRYEVDVNHMDAQKETPLGVAAGRGIEGVIKAFLEHQVDIDCKDGDGRSPLELAAKNGHDGTVELLLKCSSPLAMSSLSSALSFAAANGYTRTAKLLLKHGAEADYRDESQHTPLLWAAKNGHTEVIDLLLKHPKVNPNAENSHGQTPLCLAAQEGQIDTVRLLLADSRVNPQHRDKKGDNPLLHAAFSRHASVVEILLQIPRVDPNCRTPFGETPLAYAALNNSEEVVELLLQNPMTDPDLRNNNGNTPLAIAAMHGRDTIVERLLKLPKIDPNSENAKERTPLSLAAQNGQADAVEVLLLDNRVDANHRDKTGRTPLSWACVGGHVAATERLLADERVDGNIPDCEGRPPVLCAALGGYPMIMHRLLSTRKVDINCRDSAGLSPLARTAESGALTAVEMLLEEGADVNSMDNDRMTPLMRSVVNGHVQVAEALLAANALTTGVDHEGRTLLLTAVEAGRPEMVEFLLHDARLDPDARGEDLYDCNPLELAKMCGWDEIEGLIQVARERDSKSTSQNAPRRLGSSFHRSILGSSMGLSDFNPGWTRGRGLYGVSGV